MRRVNQKYRLKLLSCTDPEGGPGPPHMENHVAIGLLRNTGTDLTSRSNWTPWVQLLPEVG